MNLSIFREYDIRGVADRDLGDPVVRELGRAVGVMVGSAAADNGGPRGGGSRPTIAVGRDCRLTSERLREALVAGVLEVGVDVVDVGVVPTPALYYAPFAWQLDGAIIITGSHNPPPDNGFKILRGRESIHGNDIRALGQAIASGACRSAV